MQQATAGGAQELLYLGPRRLEWRAIPKPHVVFGAEAIVRPLVVASCDLDRAIVHGLTPFQPPFVLGHECVGEVLEVGSHCSSVQPGDRVVVAFQISCGECRFCRLDHAASCTSVPRESMYGIGKAGGSWGGVLATAFRVPYADAMLVPLPKGVDPAAAASASDNVGDAWRAVGPPLAERPGEPVLVLNGGPAGSIGLLAVHLALALGAQRVEYRDRDEARVEKARALGADAQVIEEWPRRLGPYSIVVDNGNEPPALASALRSTEPGGFCTSTSMYFIKELPVPIMEMYSKGVTYRTGRVESRQVLPAVLNLLAHRVIDPTRIVSERAPFTEAPAALCDYSTKLLLTPDGP